MLERLFKAIEGDRLNCQGKQKNGTKIICDLRQITWKN
jgi:hypothetical protein